MQAGHSIGAILNGGESVRMGTPKGAICLSDGRAMIEHVISLLKGVCGQVVTVGRSPGEAIQHQYGITHLADKEPGLGPLGGIETLLLSDIGEGYLVAASDQPLLTTEIFRLLMEGDPSVPRFFRPNKGEIIDPFPGYFPACLLSEVERVRANGVQSMHGFIEGITVSWIALPETLRPRIKSINTPADLAEIL